jgi:hypothetical protein
MMTLMTMATTWSAITVDGATNYMKIVSATMNKYTVTISIEVHVNAIDEANAVSHALECVDEYDGDTRITSVDVLGCEVVCKECNLCGEEFEPDEEWIETCDDCLRMEE